MQVTIENKEYSLNVNRAQELGVLKLVRKVVTDVNAGDVFKTKTASPIVVVKVSYYDDVYCFVGLNGALTPYSDDRYRKTYTLNEAIKFLNEREMYKIGNVNNAVSAAIDAMG